MKYMWATFVNILHPSNSKGQVIVHHALSTKLQKKNVFFVVFVSSYPPYYPLDNFNNIMPTTNNNSYKHRPQLMHTHKKGGTSREQIILYDVVWSYPFLMDTLSYWMLMFSFPVMWGFSQFFHECVISIFMSCVHVTINVK